MQKKMMAILLGVMISATTLCGCGGGSSSAASSTAAESAADTADSASSIHYVDGYYATDGNGNDFYIAFYENAPGDVAYVNDGTTEAMAEYTAENAQTADGQDYILITVGQTQLGYIADGTDGGAYIVDTDGNIYGAQRLTEEEADSIYEAQQNS